ncbi:MAG: extensin family protein [Hyphomicrobiales bacterium]
MVLSRFAWVLTVFVCGAILQPAPAVYGQTPIPREKPKAPAPSTAPAPAEPAATEQDEAAALEASHQACLTKLKNAGIAFSQPAAVVDEQEGCGIPFPVKISAVRNGNAEIKLPGAPVLTCEFALRFSDWATNAAAPIIAGKSGAALSAIATGPGYQCRRRNRSKTGKVSEHTRGNAIDISEFVLSDGKRIGIAKRANGNRQEMRLLTTLGLTACGYFSTVLGPGSNAAHDTHFHFDHQKRGKNWNYRLCE